MRKPGTDEQNVQMSDVLCDFCHREWREDVPMVEGHHGSCICGNCLSLAFRSVMLDKVNDAPAEWQCPLCLEASADRAELGRADEPGWPSPLDPEVVVCRRCIKQASGALHKSSDYDWRKPV
ncbi:MAG: hypothetical protein KDA25_10215 [Phycisphaerales bacterium]|nr:hypothetical protein [Phycisphaerales bacterium]